MERKEILKFAGAIIFLGIIAYFPCKVLSTETDPNLQLLATAIILTIVLGGVNMLKSLFKSDEVSREVDHFLLNADFGKDLVDTAVGRLSCLGPAAKPALKRWLSSEGTPKIVAAKALEKRDKNKKCFWRRVSGVIGGMWKPFWEKLASIVRNLRFNAGGL